MAVKFVQAAVEASAPVETDLLHILVKNLGRYYPERSHKTVHASDVTKKDFCPRQYRLMDVMGVKRPDRYLSAALSATFDSGKKLAAMFCEDWIGSSGVGDWRCRACNYEMKFAPKPPKCYGCGKKDFEYIEINFKHAKTELSGSIDILADLSNNGAGKLTVTELKIMKGEEFEKLKAPLAEHRIRTMLYLRLVDESNSPYKGFIRTDKAKVLYMSREFGKKNPEVGQIVPFKEFDVTRNDELTEPFVEKSAIVKWYRLHEKIPEYGVCSSPTCDAAKKCPVKDACWSEGATPPTYTEFDGW